MYGSKSERRCFFNKLFNYNATNRAPVNFATFSYVLCEEAKLKKAFAAEYIAEKLWANQKITEKDAKRFAARRFDEIIEEKFNA